MCFPPPVANTIMANHPDSIAVSLPTNPGAPPSHMWLAPCDAEIKLSLRFLDRNFPIQSKDLIGNQADPNFLIENHLLLPPKFLDGRRICFVLLAASDILGTMNDYVVGLPFLKSGMYFMSTP